MRHGRDRVSENSATWHSPLLGGSAVKLSVTDRSHYDAVISHPKLTDVSRCSILLTLRDLTMNEAVCRKQAVWPHVGATVDREAIRLFSEIASGLADTTH